MNPDNLITVASFTPNSLQPPNAWVGHLPFAAWVIQEVKPKIFVELGTHTGNSYFSFCQSVALARLSTKCYAVDTWQGDEHAGYYGDDIFSKVNAHHKEYYAEFSRLLRMTFDDAVTYFADESIELLHIDGLHTYEAVCHDFETWLPKLAPGAVVMFHDTNVHERDFGVWKLWEELQARYPNNLEFVHSHGLGVLQLNNASDNKRLEWLQPNSPDKQQLIRYFSTLGSCQFNRFELTELRQQIVNLNQTILERGGQINAYQLQAEKIVAQIRDASTQIEHLNQAIAERDGRINAHRYQAEEFVAQIRDASTQIEHLNQAIAERDGQINAHRFQAEEFVAQIRDASTQIEHLNQAIAERDQQIDGHRLQAEEFVAQIRDANTQIGQLNQAIAERDEKIGGHRLQLEQSEAQLHAANTKINELNQFLIMLDHDIATIRRSTSWRITKPFRFILHPLSELKLVSLGKRAYRKLTVNLDKLPEDFDRDLYLKLNPDVADAGFDPAKHYLLDGRFEGRAFSLTAMEFSGENNLKANRESSLVVRHKAIHALDRLPEDFDKNMYLKLNPDLVIAGVDPITHYLRHGYRAGRIYKLAALELCGNYKFKPDRETVLVVSHEASRTGAPMLSLNIVQAFVKSYNVVVVLLGGGPLSDTFKLSGAAVIESFQLRGSPNLANGFVSQLCGRFIFKFALVNSIESRVVLPPLGDYFVPVISLIHEFASYTRPRDAFRGALFWSGEAVFSANVTMENAHAEYPDLCDRSIIILPQGRCLLPLDGLSEEQHQAESTHIHRLIRPKGLAEETVIVLGAGSVQLRKGVDLFIECAARVVNAPDGNRCRFIWIGNGYDPDNDVGYSVYLADQIRRAGLQKHVLFIDETAAIETAYEEADLFLLSSRLDPLPNVAIDAMAHGVPLLCFDKTTGIADFLIESGLRDHCVADYIDSSNMAQKILALADSQTLRKNVGEQCRTASMAFFNMDNYIESLESVAKRVCEFTQQEKVDTKAIIDSGLFRRDFSCPPYLQGQSIEDEVRFYVRAWASGINRRKPFPGFHPGIYKEQHGLVTEGADPFADYLRSGQPKGSWNYPVIVAQEADVDELPDNHRVALHLHIYYPDLLPKIITRLARNRICPDLYISITDENVRQSIVSQLREYKGKVVEIQLVPNSGRDIGPLLTAFEPSLLVNYDFVGHIHTKKTADIKDTVMAESWYKFLLENLLGGESGPMADGILARMNNDASIGIVFPDDPYIVGWGANLTFAEPLAERMGLAKLPENFVFPVGSMFWARTSALTPLMNLKLGWDDYPEEPLPYDGTSLHALERLFSLVVSENNFRCATTNVVGLTR